MSRRLDAALALVDAQMALADARRKADAARIGVRLARLEQRYGVRPRAAAVTQKPKPAPATTEPGLRTMTR